MTKEYEKWHSWWEPFMVNLVKKKERKNLNKKNGQFTFKGGKN